jgi:DNA-binding NtrC family response regulator
VVADDADSREVLSLLLLDMGYSVTSVASGNEALHFLYSENGCDAVVTDALMPGMSGIEFGHRARAARPGMPVVLLIGTDGIDTAVASGAIPLLKPVTHERLSQVLANSFRSAPSAFLSEG